MSAMAPLSDAAELISDFCAVPGAILRVAQRLKRTPAEIREEVLPLVRQGPVVVRVRSGERFEEITPDELANAELDLDVGTVRRPIVQLQRQKKGGHDVLTLTPALGPPVPIEINAAMLAHWLMIDRRADRSGKRRGRPRQHPWDAFYCELLRYIFWNGDPQPQATLERHLASWFAENFGREPDEREIRRRVAEALEAMRAPFKERVSPVSPGRIA